ncbi:MAG: FAD-dependent oxidoreductase [Pseudomonadota bacterium]|nr:FAD-dependent oxidoreductase [Pseudomonadota bacterium]
MAAFTVDIDECRSAWTDDKPHYRPEPALASAIEADVAIVGGGFTGVSTALHLARRFPERRVALLEARQLANGASGRNGGMVLNWVNGVEHDDPARARRIYDVTRSGIDLIEDTIARYHLAAGFRRDGCLEVFTDPARAAAAATQAEWLQAAGIPIRFLDSAELAATLRIEGAAGALFDPHAAQLDGVAYLRALRPVLQALGVTVYEDTPVLSVREGAECRLATPGGEVRAKAIVLATNAYTPRLGYFTGGILPLHSHVIATEPVSAARWAEVGWRGVAGFSDDLDRIAYASLTRSGPDGAGRLVFGGGSNASYGYQYGGKTTWAGPADTGFAAVEARMRRYLPGAADIRVTSRWTGPVAVTLSRVCTMGVRGEHRNVYFALGYSGHGVTLANLAGRVLTDIYSGDDVGWRDLPFYQQRLLWIPPDPMRWMGYHAYTSMTGRSPRRRL